MPLLIWIIIGCICVLLIAIVLMVRLSTSSTPVRLASREGLTMIEITSVGVVEGQLIVKGRLMGAMPATILIRPEEAWQGLGLMGARVILAMPGFLLAGWWLCLRRNLRASNKVQTNS